MSETVQNLSEAKADKMGSDVLSGLRKAAKAGDAVKAGALLTGAVEVFGSPKTVADDTVKAEQAVSVAERALTEARGLLADVSPKAVAWLKAARLAREAGVTARGWEQATGTSKNTLGRLTRGGDVFDAAKANGTPITLGEALTLGNQRNASEITAMVKAYGEAEEGTDPFADPDAPVVLKAPSVPTVEQYLKALDSLSSRLSTLLEGEYATPKADTLEQARKASAVIERISKQHETLVAQIAPKARSPKARKSA